jgi:hypothetical protein
MAEFAQWIESAGATKEDVREALVEYFNNPTLMKWMDSHTNHSVYRCKTQCWLNRECGFIVAFVPRDMHPPGAIRRLSEMDWDAFQTVVMLLEGSEHTPSAEYIPHREGILSSVITRTKNTPQASTYSCKELPIVVTLSGEGKNGANWTDEGRVINALESYRTTITWTA